MAHYGNYYPSFVTSVPYSHYPGYGPAKTGYEYLLENKPQSQSQSQYQPRSYPTPFTTCPSYTTNICYPSYNAPNFRITSFGPPESKYSTESKYPTGSDFF